MSKAEDVLLRGLPADLSAKPKVYANNNIAIFKPNQFIVNVECCFEHYHFAIPTVTPPPITIGKKQYEHKANRMLSVNPEQTIMAMRDVPVREYTALFVNKKFLQEIAYTISGKTDIQFDNDSHIIGKRLRDAYESFIYEFTFTREVSPLMLDSISTQVAIQMLRELKSNLSSRMVEKDYLGRSYARKAIDFIEEYYNSDISLDDLCKVTNLSPFHFIRIFKAETGKTPHEYLLDKKIHNALELLHSNQYSLGEVSQICGFVNQSHFSSAFKKKMGVSPSIYKKEL